MTARDALPSSSSSSSSPLPSSLPSSPAPAPKGTPAAVRALVEARYGAEAPPLPLPPGGVPGATLGTLLAHRSVRHFEDRPLPEGTLPWLVAAAQSAPSSSNLQTWSVIAVQDPKRKARLAELVGDQQHVRQAPLLLVWLADLSRLRRASQAAGVTAAGLDYLDTWLMAALDAALAAQNAVVAAESLGLGTVYIGAIRNRPEEIAAELGLLPGAFAVVGLCVGHPDPQRPAQVKPRLPLQAVLSHERFEPTDLGRDLETYERSLLAFQRSEGLPPSPWARQSLARLREPGDLKGRHRLREALAHQGFELR